MTLSSENDQDVIIYALDKIIAFAKDNQYIFLAQSVWWIASVLGLQARLVIHIDNLHTRSSSVSQLEAPRDIVATGSYEDELDRQDKVLKECEGFLQASRRLRDLVVYKSSGKSTIRRINPLASTKRALRISKKKARRRGLKKQKSRETKRTESVCVVPGVLTGKGITE
jgi:hypothetical protein